MISQIKEYDYLGNGLEKFNSNWKELNIRLDSLYSQTPVWNSFYTLFSNLSSQLQQSKTLVESSSADWKSVSNVVFNMQGYWEEPVMIAYKKIFNCVANWLEIQTWLNENFPASSFPENQNIICEYMCTNYVVESIQGTFTPQYKADFLNSLAASYGVSVKNVFNFLGLENQMNSLKNSLNFLLNKYNLTDLIVENFSDVQTFGFSNFIKFDKNINEFVSEDLIGFNQTDLIFFHSYLKQYDIVYPNYTKYGNGIIDVIPRNILNQFVPLNLEVNNAGQFYFENVDGQWTYREYTGLNFCALNVCGDCYDYIDPNSLYKEKDCFRFKYLLTECEFYDPYADYNVEALSLGSVEEITILDQLIA